MSGWRHRRILLGGPLHQAPIHVDVGVKSLTPVAIRKASGAMSSLLSFDTAGSGLPEKSSRDADNAPDTNHNATHLAAVGISGRITHTFCHLPFFDGGVGLPTPYEHHDGFQAGQTAELHTHCIALPPCFNTEMYHALLRFFRSMIHRCSSRPLLCPHQLCISPRLRKSRTLSTFCVFPC